MTKHLLVEDKNYTVVGINGYRKGFLTRKEAFDTSRRMQDQMDRDGWRGEMKVYYRDGSHVEWRR